MAFKLKFQGKSKELYGSDNSMVRRGLVTPTYLMEGPGDKKPVKTQKELDAEAAEKAQANMKVVKTETKKVEGGTEKTEFLEGKGKSKGFSKDPAERAKQKQWIKDNPELYQKMLAEKKLKDQRTTFIPDEPGIKTEVEPEITYTTTENPRKPKTQDYLEGKSVQMFEPGHDYRMPGLSNLISHAIGKTPKGRKNVTLFGMKNKPVKGKRLEERKAAYDKAVLAARERRGGERDARITTQEQQEYFEKYGIMPNKFGAGRSLLYDAATGEGQTDPNQTFMKDNKGNMQKLTKKRGKLVNPVSTSPENDLTEETLVQPPEGVSNASTAEGRPVRVESESFVNRNTVANAIDPATIIKGAMMVKNLIDKKKNK